MTAFFKKLFAAPAPTVDSNLRVMTSRRAGWSTQILVPVTPILARRISPTS